MSKKNGWMAPFSVLVTRKNFFLLPFFFHFGFNIQAVITRRLPDGGRTSRHDNGRRPPRERPPPSRPSQAEPLCKKRELCKCWHNFSTWPGASAAPLPPGDQVPTPREQEAVWPIHSGDRPSAAACRACGGSCIFFSLPFFFIFSFIPLYFWSSPLKHNSIHPWCPVAAALPLWPYQGRRHCPFRTNVRPPVSLLCLVANIFPLARIFYSHFFFYGAPPSA